MIDANFDMARLERSLRRASSAFGDTTQQAVTRWAVQVGREMAVSTQAYGKSNTKQKQQFAIEADARNVIFPVKILRTSSSGQSVRYEFNGRRGSWPSGRVLRDEGAVNDWIEMHRTRRRARTSKLPFPELAICDTRIFKKAMKIRFARAGMAKGGWLGAANKAATFQRGAQRISIGRNFLGYAQKHNDKGDAKLERGAGFRPIAKLINKARHSSNRYVLAPSEIRKGIGFALRKTLSWYRAATRRALDE